MTTGADADLTALVAGALAEDVGDGDVTANATVPATARARARIVQKQPGVVFGFAAAREVFRQTGAGELDVLMVEGQWRDSVPAEVAFISGPARALLAAERTALNLLGHLSGIATLTATYVEAARAAAPKVAILDTRKTTPGLRALEKAAVRAGGGRNHRMGLYDAILIKENHIAIAGGLGPAVAAARSDRPDLAKSRSSAATRPRSRRRWPPAPTGCCSTTWTRPACAPPSPPATRPDRRPGSRRRAE